MRAANKGLAIGLLAIVFSVARAETITVFAAASLSDVLQQAAASFTASSGHDVRFNFAASGTLVRHIEAGAPADLVVTADEARLEQLAARGLLRAETRQVLARNQLVVIVPKGTSRPPGNAFDLAATGIRRVAIGEPSTVPAGSFARAFLERQGLWERVRPKLVPLDNVRAVLTAVAGANADAGFVYRTDAARSPDVAIAWAIAIEDTGAIVYPAAVLRDARSPRPAAAFLAYLTHADAQAVFEQHGFLPAR